MTEIARGIDVRSVPCADGATVELLLSSADIRVRGTDGDQVVVRTRDGRPVDEEVTVEVEPGRIRVRDGDGSIRIGPINLRIRGSSDLDVEVPRRAAIACRTFSGDIHAEGIGGPSRWSSASGDIQVSAQAGPIAIDTAAGDVQVEASVAVAAAVKSVSGDVRLAAPRLESLTASSTSGDVHVVALLAPGARHVLSSVSGDVEIETGSPIRLETQTITGDVRAFGVHRAEGGRGRRTIVVGDGSVPVSVRTTSGDVVVRPRAADDAATRGPATQAPEPRPPVPPVAPEPPVAMEAPLMPIVPEPPVVPEPPIVVAEAEAAPNLVRDSAGSGGAEGLVDRREAARLDILRALERGDLDIETASQRLELLEDAAPRAFRGWC